MRLRLRRQTTDRSSDETTLRCLNLDGVRYALTPVGSGGCATVFRAEAYHRRHNQLLIKVPYEHVLSRAHGRRRWRNECDILSRLRHAAIPRPVIIRELPRPFMAYPYLPGLSLGARVGKRAGLPLAAIDKAAAVGIRLLDILAYLHTCPKPVAHGDVTPGNVLVDQDGSVRLIDFGCAVEVQPDRYSPWVAAPRYLSPEQAQGRPWDGRSDVYQVGLILYELLTGQPYNTAADHRAAMLTAAAPRTVLGAKLNRSLGRSITHWLADVLEPDERSRTPSAACAAGLLIALTGK